MKKPTTILSALFSLSLLINIAFICRYNTISKLYTNFFKDEKTYNEIEFRSSQYIGFTQLYRSLNYSNIDILFLGDSLTERSDYNILFSEYNVSQQGIGGDTIYGLYNRIDIIKKCNPKYVFIEIGTNDILNQIEIEHSIFYYDKIICYIKENCPETTIFIESIYPITENYSYLEYIITLDKVVDLNNRIRELAINHNIEYIDIYSQIAEPNGFLSSENSCDGIHLNGSLYIKISEILKSYIAEYHH